LERYSNEDHRHAQRSRLPAPGLIDELVKEFEDYWDIEQTLWFLLTDKAPDNEPLSVNIVRRRVGKHLSYAQVTLQIEPWVSAETVANYYRFLQISILGHIPRALSVRNLKLTKFVLNHLRGLVTAEVRREGTSGMPTWRTLMHRWNKTYSDMVYDNERLFHRDFFRTARSVMRPFGPMQEANSGEGATGSRETEQLEVEELEIEELEAPNDLLNAEPQGDRE